MDDTVIIDDDDEGARLQADALDTSGAANWSSGTCSCLLSPSSAILSCLCPCVQFGFNQRMAFQESCIKWTLFWICPLLLLFIVATALLADDGGGTAELVLRNIDADPDAPPPPQPRSRAPYVLPPAMVLVGLVGCMRRKLLRQKYGIAGRCARAAVTVRSPPPPHARSRAPPRALAAPSPTSCATPSAPAARSRARRARSSRRPWPTCSAAPTPIWRSCRSRWRNLLGSPNSYSHTTRQPPTNPRRTSSCAGPPRRRRRRRGAPRPA